MLNVVYSNQSYNRCSQNVSREYSKNIIKCDKISEKGAKRSYVGKSGDLHA